MYSEGISQGWYVTYPSNGVNITYTWQICLPSKGSTQRILTSVYFILGFLLPLGIITVAYSKIALYLWRKSRKNQATNQAALKSKGKALQMLVLSVLGFVVCLGVPQVNDLISSFGFDDLLFFFLFSFGFSSCPALLSIPLFMVFILVNLNRDFKTVKKSIQRVCAPWPLWSGNSLSICVWRFPFLCGWCCWWNLIWPINQWRECYFHTLGKVHLYSKTPRFPLYDFECWPWTSCLLREII